MKKLKDHKVLATLLIVIFLVMGGIAYLITSDYAENFLTRRFSETTNRHIHFENGLKIDWGWPVTTLTAHNLVIDNFDQGTRPEMFTVKDVKVSINLFSILKGNVRLHEVILDSPDLWLEKDKDGKANWDFSQNPDASLVAENVTPDDRTDIPLIDELVITNGRLRYIDAVQKTDIDMKVDTVKGEAERKQNLQLDGTGTYQNHQFAMKVTGGNIFKLKETDEPYPVNIDTTIGNTRITLTGTMLDPLQLKGMNTKLTLKGKDAAELFDVFGIALPPTPPYDVTGDLSYQKDIWHFEDFKGRMGKSDLSGTVTWDKTRKRPLLSGEFRSKRLNFADLGGFVGAGPGADEKTKRDAYAIPDTPLDISRLKAMDAKVNFTGEQLISNDLPLDDFAMKVDLDNSILKLQPVRFGTARGDISAHMTVNARKEPVKIDGDFRFHRLALKPMFEKLSDKLNIPNYAEGYLGGTAKLQGTGKSLRQMLATSHGDIGLGMEGGQLSNLVIEVLGLDVAQGLGLFLKKDKPVPVRCMIGDFNVDNGMMQVRHFVLDTTDSNILGSGSINLKNEALDLTLYTNPKDNSPLTLNAPVGVKGTIKNPQLDVSRSLGRGAIGAMIGALIFPPAAIVAFVEPAFGKDSPCAALINEMAKNNEQGKTRQLVPKNTTKTPDRKN